MCALRITIAAWSGPNRTSSQKITLGPIVCMCRESEMIHTHTHVLLPLVLYGINWHRGVCCADASGGMETGRIRPFVVGGCVRDFGCWISNANMCTRNKNTSKLQQQQKPKPMRLSNRRHFACNIEACVQMSFTFRITQHTLTLNPECTKAHAPSSPCKPIR